MPKKKKKIGGPSKKKMEELGLLPGSFKSIPASVAKSLTYHRKMGNYERVFIEPDAKGHMVHYKMKGRPKTYRSTVRRAGPTKPPG